MKPYAIVEALGSKYSDRAWFARNRSFVSALVDRALLRSARSQVEADAPKVGPLPTPVPLPESPWADIRFVIENGVIYLQFPRRDVWDKFAVLKDVDPGQSYWGLAKARDGDWWAKTRLSRDLMDALRAYRGQYALTPAQIDLLEKLRTHARPPFVGGFELLSSGYTKLRTPRAWRPYPPVAGIVATRQEGKGDSKQFYHLFKTSRAADMVAPALAEAGFGDLAKRLADATRRYAEPYDPKAAACDPLRDMADAPTPDDVKHPIGRAVLYDVEEAMRIGAPAKLKLFPYQTVGVGFLKLRNYRGIVGDQPGLGKTAQGLAGIIVEGAALLPAVVVAPAVAFGTWQSQCRMWIPSLPIYPMPKRNSPAPPKGFRGLIITTFATLPYQIEAILSADPQYFIVDEAHKMKNADTQQSEACTAMALSVPHIVLLTGTPIENNVSELWPLLQAVETEDFGRKNEFIDDFARTETVWAGSKSVTKIVGTKNEDVLKHRLQCLMIRRLNEQVAKDRPELTRQYVPVELSDSERAEYRRVESNFEKWLHESLTERIAQGIEEAGEDATTPEAQSAIRAEVRKSAERTLAAEAITKMNALRRLAGILKIPSAIDFCIDMVEMGEPVVVFGYHHEVVEGITEGLRKAGVRVGLVSGETSKADKARLTADPDGDFQTGKIDVIVGSEAMQTAVTLTRSRTVLMVEHLWTPAREEQSEARAHRTGQKNAVNAVYLELPNSIDDRMHAIIEAKRKTVKDVVGAMDVKEDRVSESMLLASYLDGSNARVKSAAATRSNPAEAKKAHTLKHKDVVAVVFDPRLWTEGQAKRWLSANGFTGGHLESMSGSLVMRVGTGIPRGRGKSAVVAKGVTFIL